MSQLLTIIEKLSKSSPDAVYTPKSLFDLESKNVFDYLYIETDIEKDYRKLLEEKKSSNTIIFLSGSSGDGKSAIIGNNQKTYIDSYDTHIDATHSFRPNQSAIEALNEVFANFKSNNKSLVVGINIGILLNFSREGSDEHNDIKDAITHYINDKEQSEKIRFINFEDYPKFEMTSNAISSSFIHNLLNKITLQSDKNPFYSAFDEDLKNDSHTTVHQNFKLLSIEAIKSSIVELLVTTHLKYDQFLTTRGIIDFIYTVLKGPKLLIDQLFEDDTNAIIQNIRKEDPILYRTKRLDTFILERPGNKDDLELEIFIEQFNTMCKEPILKSKDPHTLIRTFFLFRKAECSTNYHKKFTEDYKDEATLDFIRLVSAHNENSNQAKSIVNNFYKDMRKAIFAYANKHAPQLTDQKLFTFSYLNSYHVCTQVKIQQDFEALKKADDNSINSFQCALKVNEHPIEPIRISLSMYKMILSINQGYRPNKHDRNSIIIFEELLEKIADKVKNANELVFTKNKTDFTFTNNIDEIEVSKHVN
jgi:DNA phosphorothioation-dependent restriction protein DptF